MMARRGEHRHGTIKLLKEKALIGDELILSSSICQENKRRNGGRRGDHA